MTHVRVTLPLQVKLPVQSLTYLLTGSSVHHLLSIIHLKNDNQNTKVMNIISTTRLPENFIHS